MSALSFTLPLLLIVVAFVLWILVNGYYRRQDRFYENHLTEWETELERRRLQRLRAERRHAVSEARRRGAEQYRRGVVR